MVILVTLLLGVLLLFGSSCSSAPHRKLLQQHVNSSATGAASELAVNHTYAYTAYILADVELLPEQDSGAAYAVWQQDDLEGLIKAHSTYQTQMLSDANQQAVPPAILVTASDKVGLGNRLPSIATAYVIALYTKRLLLIDSTLVMEYTTLPFPADWHKHKGRYSKHEVCIPLIQGYTELHQCDPLNTYGSNSTDAGNSTKPGLRDAVLLKYRSIDYEMPLLQINRQMSGMFTKFFPDGEVFHAVAGHLFKPAPAVIQAMQPYMNQAEDCAIGLHVRRKKKFHSAGSLPQLEQFATIARMLAQPEAGTLFLASDSDVFDEMQRLLGSRLWWSNLTSTSVGSTHTAASNPGTEISAFVDVFILSMCKAVVVSPASSLGYVAAGLAGVRPVFVTFGKHEAPFVNPWFWQSVTSEPCMFKAGKAHGFGGEMAARLKADHPLYMYHTQCHW